MDRRGGELEGEIRSRHFSLVRSSREVDVLVEILGLEREKHHELG
jgi:hypothetical protein